MQQWYMKAFNATFRPGQTDFFIGADLTGSDKPQLLPVGRRPVHHSRPHSRRVVDHVGFEVKDLDAFCKELKRRASRPFTRKETEP